VKRVITPLFGHFEMPDDLLSLRGKREEKFSPIKKCRRI